MSIRLAAFVGFLSFMVPLHAAEDLTFPGADGKDHTPLSLPADEKGTVLFFVSPYCPTANTFIKEINRIITDHSASFACYLVHSDKDLKLTDILQHTEMNEIKATVLMDAGQKLAKRTGARITPEAVVLSPDGKVLYKGRINDLYLGPTKRQRKATTRDLEEALEAIRDGKPVATPMHEAMGCKIAGLE